MPTQRIRLLGPVTVVEGRDERPVGGPVPQALLARLALEPGTEVPTDRLIGDLWGDQPPPTAEGTLASHVSRLRRAVGADQIARRGRSYALHLDEDAVDAVRFAGQEERARLALQQGRPDEALLAADAALGMWRGLPLSGLERFPFTAAAQERILRRRTDVLLLRGEALLVLERIDDAIRQLESAVADAPERERAWELLARALYRADRQHDALDTLRRATTTLRDRWGLDPGPRLLELEQAILRHDPELSAHGARGGAHLPASSSPLFGRDEELRALLPRLRRRDGGVTVLTGPPGVGKTRLAAELVRRLDRPVVHWVDVRAANPADEDLTASLSRVIGVPFSPVRPVQEVVVASLRLRPAVVVLDGAEHAEGSVEDLLALLASDAPATTVLVTSRRAITVPGATVRRVDPLAVDTPDGGLGPAVQLYRHRTARTVGVPLEQIADADARAVCRALDGLPLAIEVASGLVPTFGSGELATRIRAGVDLLVRVPAADAPLVAALRGSTQVLETSTRATLAVAATFASQFSLRDLEAVTRSAGLDPDDVPGDLHVLVSHSLVEASTTSGGERRYRLLDVIRAHVTSVAGPDASDRNRRAHTTWARDVAHRTASEIHGSQQARCSDELGRLVAELDQAVIWALRHDPPTAMGIVGDLAYPMFVRSLLDTQRRWVESVSAVVPRSAWNAGMWFASAITHYARYDLAAACEDCDRATELPEDAVQRAVHHFWQGAFRAALGQEDDSRAALDAATRIAAEIGLAPVESCAATTRAWAALFAGRADDALQRARAVRHLAVHSEDPWAMSYLDFVHGLAALALGRIDEASERHADGLWHAREIGHLTGAAELMATVGLAAARRGAFRDASRLLGAIDGLYTVTGMAKGMAVSLAALTGELEGRLHEDAYVEGSSLPFDDAVELALRL